MASQSDAGVKAGEEVRLVKCVGPAPMNAELGILRKILKRAKLWARVADDIRPLKEPGTIGRALSEDDKQQLLKTALSRPEWETDYLAAILCLNTTARGAELKGLTWDDVDLFGKTLTTRKSETRAGERTIPLNRVACSAFARLLARAEAFGEVEPAHYVFGSYVSRRVFNGKEVVGAKLTGFDPTKHVNPGELLGVRLPKLQGWLASATMTFATFATALSPRWPNAGHQTPQSCPSLGTSADGCWSAIVTFEWRPNGKRLKHSHRGVE